MKSNKGISLITLIITIIVIVILATITIYYGLFQNADKAVQVNSINEVYSMIDAVANRALLNRINPSYYSLVGTQKDISEIKNEELKAKYAGTSGWYLINSKDQFSELGLDNIAGHYWVNYETGDVLVENGMIYKESTYYSLNELKTEMGGGIITLANAEFDEVKKVNKPILNEGMIPVKYVNDKWIITIPDDPEWYDYSKDKNAWANIMLQDELTVKGEDGSNYTNEEVRGMTLSELVGMTVVKEGSAYVWIPRYSTNSLSNGADIIFSNLTQDVTSLNGVTYTVPNSFHYGALQLTGIWMSKYDASYDR